MESLGKYLALKGNIRVLALQLVFSQIGFGMMYVIWQPYILSAGIDVVQLGTIQSIIYLSTSLGLLIWGHISDRVGRKPVLILAECSRVVALIALILSPHLIFLYIFAFFVGFSALWMQANPARNALVYESAEDGRASTAYSVLMAASQITSTIVASIGGYLALEIGYKPLFYLTLFVEILGIIILSFFLEETHEPIILEGSKFSMQDRLLNSLLPEKNILLMCSILAVMGFSYTTAYSLWYGTLVDDLGYNTLQLGIITTAFNVGWAVTSIPLGSFSDKYGKKKAFIASWSMAMLSAIGFMLSRSLPLFILFQLVSALDISFWIPAWSGLVASQVASGQRSTVFGKIDAYSKIAGIPAPWVAGIFYSRYGYMAPLFVHVSCLILSGALIYKLVSAPDFE